MTIDYNDLAQKTSKYLQKLTNTADLHLSPEVYKTIGESIDLDKLKIDRQIRLFNGGKGNKFKLPIEASSIPYIWDIEDDGNVKLATIDVMNYKLKKKKRLHSENQQYSQRSLDFKKTLQEINKSNFKNGIDLDNFVISNISKNPVNKTHVKELLKYGKIVPLNSKKGIFVPNFALHPNYFSLEYEGRWKIPSGTPEQKLLNKIVIDPIKETTGIEVSPLMTYDFSSGHSTSTSFTAYNDGSFSSIGNRTAREIVIGSAPLSNMIMMSHLMTNAWKQTGILDRRDVVMDKFAGMHISTTVPNSDTHKQEVISTYLNHVGSIFNALTKTNPRWESSSYLGMRKSYDSERHDFRFGSGGRLEIRYPGPVANEAYISNQLIFASKIGADTRAYTKRMENQNVPDYEMPEFSTIRLRNKTGFKEDILTPLTERGMNQTKRWFNNFLDNIGIKTQFEKQFVVNMAKQCSMT